MGSKATIMFFWVVSPQCWDLFFEGGGHESFDVLMDFVVDSHFFVLNGPT